MVAFFDQCSWSLRPFMAANFTASGDVAPFRAFHLHSFDPATWIQIIWNPICILHDLPTVSLNGWIVCYPVLSSELPSVQHVQQVWLFDSALLNRFRSRFWRSSGHGSRGVPRISGEGVGRWALLHGIERLRLGHSELRMAQPSLSGHGGGECGDLGWSNLASFSSWRNFQIETMF